MRTLLLVGAAVGVVALAAARSAAPDEGWTEAERGVLATLELGALRPLPPDPTNRVADDPRAAALGHRLFFDARLSGNGRVSCASCHDPAREFQDGTPLATGVGTTGRRTMPVAGTAHGPWLFWDGRKDSQWSQALGPWESPVEHGGDRTQYARAIAERYGAEYEALFGRLPDLSELPAHAGPVADSSAAAAWAAMAPEARDRVNRVFANMGKAVAAYERLIAYGPSRFDRYAREVAESGRAPRGVLTADEVAGLRLFIGKAGCTGCHTGPLFTDQAFHNTGVAAAPDLPADPGRAGGVGKALGDEFNCRSRYSDAPGSCAELEFAVTAGEELVRAFKTPSLRNVARRAPYMHAGQLATLEDVVAHYREAPAAPDGRSEVRPLDLSARERRQLVAFLRALTAPLATPDSLLAAPR